MSSTANLSAIIEDYKRKLEYYSNRAKNHETQIEFHQKQAMQCNTEIKVLTNDLEALTKIFDREIESNKMEIDELSPEDDAAFQKKQARIASYN